MFPRSSSVLLIALLGLFACEQEKKDAEDTKREPWVHESARAPYKVKLSGSWKREDPAVLNEFADLAVSHSKDIFFIVIPQELPPAPDEVDPPDSLDLKRAGMMLMEAQIESLEIQKQGPVRVDERQGQSVVAKGVVSEQPVKYVTTYLTDRDWGFQLVGWAPLQRQHDLMVEIDKLLAGWEFVEPEPETEPEKPADTPSISMDMGPEAAADGGRVLGE